MADRTKVELLKELGGAVAIREGLGGERIIVHDFMSPSDGQPRRVRAWHRIAIRGAAFVLADFNFLADQGVADRSDVLKLRDFVEGQALAAVLRARQAASPP
jgi:hypothetical protein